MKKILAKNLLDEIIKLTPEQKIFIDFPTEVCNRLELLGLQIKSLQNLFQSYLNDTNESANEFNLNKFKDMFADLVIEKEMLFKDNVLKCFGTKVYNYCMDRNNKVGYSLDFNLKKLVVIKQGMFRMVDRK